MPTYNYECSECGYEWEIERPITSEPEKECPKCHAMTAKRLISGGSNFILTGGGWANEGYAK